MLMSGLPLCEDIWWMAERAHSWLIEKCRASVQWLHIHQLKHLLSCVNNPKTQKIPIFLSQGIQASEPARGLCYETGFLSF